VSTRASGTLLKFIGLGTMFVSSVVVW
jgi:hypothetical protein